MVLNVEDAFDIDFDTLGLARNPATDATPSTTTSFNLSSLLTASQGITSLASMYVTSQASKIRQLTYEHNAIMAEHAKYWIDRAVAADVATVREQGRQILGTARVAGASSGFALDSVSQQNIESATIRSVEQDVAALKIAGEVEAFNLSSEASASLAAASAEENSSNLQNISTLLSTTKNILDGI